jgi:GntR family transcriptional regulator
VPYFQRIVNDIRSRIASGEWPDGHRLPSTARLTEMYGDLYGVRSSYTVRRAVLLLLETGELRGHKGVAVWVCDPPRPPSHRG